MTGHDASAHAPSGHGGPEAVHPKELEFDEQVRKDRHTAAMRLQGIVRARQAFMKVNERKKKKREMLPAQDEHGHANPATIRYWTPAPMVHIHHHEESFFELFYDLIIVVVLMNLSYLKYEMTFFGFFTVLAIFSNFWSVWSLLNVYTTMLHQEDAVHRLYYALHVVMSFVMCVATTHPKFAFFDFRYQGFFLIMSSIIVRFWTLGMWLLFLKVDGNMRSKPEFEAFLPKYSRADVVSQVKKHAGSIAAAMVILAVTAPMVYEGDPVDGTEVRAGDNRRHLTATSSYSASYSASYSSTYSAYSSSGDDDAPYRAESDTDQYWGVIALWLLAVAVEQVGNVHASVFNSLPFSGEYCGDRMQAWLMLCFGESLIGLLVNPLYFDAVSIKSVLAAFVMVFCLVTGYFDITDADKFLHLFLLRNEKWKAFTHCLNQLTYSLFVFLVGVALKSIVYVNAAVHDLETASGCEHATENFRRLAWAPGGELDKVASALGSEQFGEHYNLAGGLGDQGGGGHRRLAGSFTLDQYDDLLGKLYWLLQGSVICAQAFAILVAYAMPTDQDMKKVHLSRIGAIVVTLCGLAVPPSLQSIKTTCLVEYEDSHRRRLTEFVEDYTTTSPQRDLASTYSSSYSAYSSGSDDDSTNAGLSVTEALIVSAVIVCVSFAIQTFAIDVEREHTYKELEEAAEHGREPVLHTLEESKKKKTLAERGGVAFVASGFGAPKVNPTPAQ